MRSNHVVVSLLLVLITGCGSQTTRTTTTTVETRRGESVESPRTGTTATLDGLVANVQSARNAQQEADALRALRDYETQQGMTYAVRTVNRDTGEAVAGPTMSSTPLRTEVSIFRGRDLVRTFSFLPKDPRNLALLGE
jgi:hypothetical protein